MLLSVVVPAYNEEEALPILYDEVKKHIPEDVSWELIIVDDGSKDRTAEIIQQLNRENPSVKGVILSRNFGHQSAILAGLSYARGDAIIVMDADLQDPPHLIPIMLQKFKEGYEIVYGVRKERKDPFFKKHISRLFYRVFRVVAFDMPEDAGDFALMSRRVASILVNLPEKNKFLRGLRAWAGFKQTSVTYHRPERVAGKTKYTPVRMIMFALNGLVSFSFFPLRFIFFLGLVAFLVSLVFIGAVLISYLKGDVVRGWTSLAMLVLFIGSIQLLSVSVIGEYIGRIYDEVKHRPPFIVEKTIGL